MDNKVLDVANYERLKKMMTLTLSTIDQKLDFYRDTMTQDQINSLIDKTFHDEFDYLLQQYKQLIGQPRFTKLIEKHMPQADPQSVVIHGKGEDSKNKVIEQQYNGIINGDQKILMIREIRELCFKATPSEEKMKEVNDKVGIIIEKQNDIIRKINAAQGEEVKQLTKEIGEKLKHTMFMIQ